MSPKSPPSIRDKPWVSKPLNQQTIRDRAEFIAFEIFNDRLAPEAEIADAIEGEIIRFANSKWVKE